VEYGRTPGVIADPVHAYTRALLAAIPEPDPDRPRLRSGTTLRSADIPSLLRLPSGCTFHPRCPIWEQGLCDTVRPTLVPIEEGRFSSCHVIARERTGAIAAPEAVAAD
jgi:oligopeptide/dipeptide ABC transporter ATP-binding protein